MRMGDRPAEAHPTPRRRRHWWKGGVSPLTLGEGGGSAIEFALTAPLIFALVFGIIDFTRLAFSQAALHFAAQEATRFAIVREGRVGSADIRAFAESQLLDVFGLDGATFTISTAPDPISNTSVLTVIARQDFAFLLPFLPKGAIRLTAESRGFLAFPGGLPGGG